LDEKEIPKALKLYHGTYKRDRGRVHCPNCEELLPVGNGKISNCPFCDQKLDWDLPMK